MTDRTTVRLPDALKEHVMRIAADEGRTLTSLIIESLNSLIAQRREGPRPRIVPRVSQAKGWLAPGVKDLKEAQQLEDIEYVERLRRLK